MECEELKHRVIAAIRAFYERDGDLLDVYANERSITHKLAEHLQREFPEWHVDCEYNRLGHDTKRLPWTFDTPRPDDVEAKTVFPDIIVHRRKTDNNLLIMEVKKAGNKAGNRDKTWDIEKLKLFTQVPEYQYQYGLSLELEQNGHSKLELYIDGESCGSWTEDLQCALRELGYGE